MISLKDIVIKSKTKIIINKISLTINKGDFIYLYGSNGSGKTTLAKVLSGFVKPNEGQFFLNNELINKNNIEKIKQKSLLLFQDIDNFFIYKTVKRDFAFSLENKNLSYDLMDQKINQLINKFNLNSLEQKLIENLSGGQKQKIALISFELDYKDILILDESFSMLDPNNRKELFNLISKLNSIGVTIIYISHNLIFPFDLINQKYIYLNQKEAKLFTNENDFLLYLYQNNLIYNDYFNSILKNQLNNQNPLTLSYQKIIKRISKND